MLGSLCSGSGGCICLQFIPLFSAHTPPPYLPSPSLESPRVSDGPTGSLPRCEPVSGVPGCPSTVNSLLFVFCFQKFVDVSHPLIITLSLASASLLGVRTLFYSFTSMLMGSWERGEIHTFVLLRSKLRLKLPLEMVALLSQSRLRMEMMSKPPHTQRRIASFRHVLTLVPALSSVFRGSRRSTPFPQPQPSRPCRPESPQLRNWRPAS